MVNTTNTAITVGYVYTLTNPTSGCTNTQTVSVVVNPIPVVSNQTLTNCSGSLFNLIPSGVPLGTTYSWAVPVSAPLGVISGTSGLGASSISEILNNSSVNPATATYTITPSVGGCAGASFTLIVTVNPVATIAPQVLTPVCSGTAFSFVPVTVPIGTTYSWSNPVISPVSGLSGGSAQSAQSLITQTLTSTNNLVNTAVYTITPSSNSCPGTDFTVTVQVNPVPHVTTQSTTICSGNSFSIIPAPVPIGTTYTWSAPVLAPLGSISGAVCTSNSCFKYFSNIDKYNYCRCSSNLYCNTAFRHLCGYSIHCYSYSESRN